MADTIYANTYTQFGPCDPQIYFDNIGCFSSKDYARLSSNKYKDNLIKNCAISVNKQVDNIILSLSPKIKEQLFSGSIPHGTSLSVPDMKELGIDIKSCPEEINTIFNLL